MVYVASFNVFTIFGRQVDGDYLPWSCLNCISSEEMMSKKKSPRGPIHHIYVFYFLNLNNTLSVPASRVPVPWDKGP